MEQIFQEGWDNYLSKHQNSVPDYVVSTVNKMLNCRNPQKLGYHKYACPDHPEEFIVFPHSCKSRFCNTCGKILTDKWITKVEKDFPQSSFHHICFTIPDSLRLLLDKNKRCLDVIGYFNVLRLDKLLDEFRGSFLSCFFALIITLQLNYISY